MSASSFHRRAAAAMAVWAAWSVAAAAAPCAVGTWTVPGGGPSLAVPELMAASARRAVVLLGEHHDNAEHHRWQLHTVAALHAYRPDLVLGFEMFPQSAQPALDAWVRGDLDETDFLKQVNWNTVWGFPPALYMPLFHFARQNRVPMVALNVDRALVARVGREGWEAVPPAERAGVGDPAPPDEAYRRSLARVFAFKRRHGRQPPKQDAPAEEPGDEEIAAALADPAFARFVAAQQVWDRVMAEGIAAAHGRADTPLVVGIVGQGHAEHGWGIPHQLRDLGIDDTAVLLPVNGTDACAEAPAGIADAVFVVEPRQTAHQPGPHLGVMLDPADGGIRIARVLEDSVAERAGLKAGDVVVEAAGAAVRSAGDLTAVIRRQAPGTWLPLSVRRGDETTEIIARFPASFGPSQ